MRSARVVSSVMRMMLGRWEAAAAFWRTAGRAGCLLCALAGLALKARMRRTESQRTTCIEGQKSLAQGPGGQEKTGLAAGLKGSGFALVRSRTAEPAE